MSNRILFVDDDANLLSACKRSLRDHFDIETALGGPEGLNLITTQEPFAVILADMRMPIMDGIEFLSKAKDLAPHSVRMMLTGNVDMDTAVNAVNEGHIFRFLTKPCPKELLAKSVEAGVQQYQLIIAERQLLEETLNGSIKVMTDILSLVNPMAFGCASRIRRYVRQIAEQLSLSNIWQIEVAAMLSQIGCVSLPGDTLERVYAGQELAPEEQKMIASHPDIGGRLIVNIPRLKEVAHMISRQQEPFSWDRSGQAPHQRDEVAVGGHVLKVAIEFDKLFSRGMAPKDVVARFRQEPEVYDSDIVEALTNLKVSPDENQRRVVNIHELDIHMILDQDVYSSKDGLLVTKGQEMTLPVLEHLRRWAQGVGVKEPIRVLVPNYATERETCSRRSDPS